MASGPVSLDGRSGALKVDERVAERLGLDAHPMVAKVGEVIGQGFTIRTSLRPNARRGYGKVFLEKGGERITVGTDGAVLDRWPDV